MQEKRKFPYLDLRSPYLSIAVEYGPWVGTHYHWNENQWLKLKPGNHLACQRPSYVYIIPSLIIHPAEICVNWKYYIQDNLKFVLNV